jgi:hypothetical protein
MISEAERLLSDAAVHYAVRELANRGCGAVPLQELGVRIVYGSTEVGDSSACTVHIRRTSPEDLAALFTANHVDWVLSPEWLARDTGERRLPVLCWGEGFGRDGSLLDVVDATTVVINADLVAATIFMLTRWEEHVMPQRDSHDRFPAAASLAARAGFLDRPIVDEYGLFLRHAIQRLLPRWAPIRGQFHVRATHDVDWPVSLPSRGAIARQLAGDIVKRRSFESVRGTLTTALQDPWYGALYELAQLSSTHRVESAFYFMAARPRPPDLGYRLTEPRVARFLAWLRERDVEIGFHPGYYTYNDWDRFEEERYRLANVIPTALRGGRQHVLRFEVPTTWRLWERAGFAYESTLGYADAEGFRCGTCHPFRPFDVEWQRDLDLLEVPLIVMDVTLRRYQAYSVETAAERIRTLAARCQRVGGCFVILWHNNYVTGDWESWAQMYRNFIASGTQELGVAG